MSRSWQPIAWIVGAVCLFFAYAWLPLTTSGVWNAPDEAAVAYAATAFPEQGLSMAFPLPSFDALTPLVHPRSMFVSSGQLLPAGWIGLPLALRAVVLTTGLPFDIVELLVPAIAVLAVGAWYVIARRLFLHRAAAAAAMALWAVHPGWIYFVNRGLHPNVFFLSLLVIGAALTVVAATRQQLLTWQRNALLLLGGVCIGGGLTARANEAVWVVPVLIALAVLLRAHWRRTLLVAVGVIVPLLVLFGVHQSLYGNWLGGYLATGDTVEVVSEVPSETVERASSFGLLFPFGIHERNTWRHVRDYHLIFFAAWTALSLFGFRALVIDNWDHMSPSMQRRWKWFTVLGLLAAVYLFVLYGSWVIRDNPDPTAVTIGSSYIRYWLPVSLWMTAYGAITLVWLAELLSRNQKRVRDGLLALGVVALAVHAWFLAYNGPDEGLRAVRVSLTRGMEERAYILSTTEGADLVIADYSDKFLVGERTVLSPLRDETVLQSLPGFVDVQSARGAEVYYFGLPFTDEDQQYLQETYLTPGYVLVPVGTVTDKQLYRIEQE